MLYIFDLDNTLVLRFKAQPMPGVSQKLDDLTANRHDIAVATNQAGLAWRVWTGENKFPTVERLTGRFEKVTINLPQLLAVPWFVAVHDSRVELSDADYANLVDALSGSELSFNLHVSAEACWRKPGPGMLQAALKWYGRSPEEACYVGDMETDAGAAMAAGIRFMYANEFFTTPTG